MNEEIKSLLFMLVVASGTIFGVNTITQYFVMQGIITVTHPINPLISYAIYFIFVLGFWWHQNYFVQISSVKET